MNKLFLVTFFIAGSCILYAQSAGSAEAAARDDARRLDEALGGKTSGGGTQPAQVSKGGPEPAWVLDPYKAYPHSRYIAAVGFAKNRDEAEKKALAELAAIFGQSIKSDFSVATVYSEAVSKGIIVVSGNTNVRDTIVAAVSLDTLIGAEIGNVWDDGRGIVYALACMDREKTIAVYTEIIRMNQINIDRLTMIKDARKYTFDGYARYKMAELISGINAKYANIVTQAGGQVTSLNLDNADAINLEAADILRNITVSITIDGDQNDRIRYAFVKILNGAGLSTQDGDSPYVLAVTVSLNQVTVPNNNNVFCRYSVTADFIESDAGLTLFSFNDSGRTVHLTYEGAKDRAVTGMEKIINEQYSTAFKECLAAILPQK
jgi:hypothetical protein